MRKLVAVFLGIIVLIGAYIVFVMPMTDNVMLLIKVCTLFLVVGLVVSVVRKLRTKKTS